MAGVPDRPPRPLYVDSDATSITLEILTTTNNNGAIVTKYYIYRDTGDYSSTVSTLVAGYDGTSSTY
jgi:hypothetical protein